MPDITVIVLMVSFLVLAALLVLVSKERRAGRRFFAAGPRNWLDRKIEAVEHALVKNWGHFTKYVIQLHWYYSIHSVLRGLLKLIIAFYNHFENIFERNRHRTKQLRAEKRQLNELNHLQQMTKHKEETALTPAQQQKLKKKKLEERH